MLEVKRVKCRGKLIRLPISPEARRRLCEYYGEEGARLKRAGDLAGARACFEQALEISHQLEIQEHTCQNLEILAIAGWNLALVDLNKIDYRLVNSAYLLWDALSADHPEIPRFATRRGWADSVLRQPIEWNRVDPNWHGPEGGKER